MEEVFKKELGEKLESNQIKNHVNSNSNHNLRGYTHRKNARKGDSSSLLARILALRGYWTKSKKCLRIGRHLFNSKFNSLIWKGRISPLSAVADAIEAEKNDFLNPTLVVAEYMICPRNSMCSLHSVTTACLGFIDAVFLCTINRAETWVYGHIS